MKPSFGWKSDEWLAKVNENVMKPWSSFATSIRLMSGTPLTLSPTRSSKNAEPAVPRPLAPVANAATSTAAASDITRAFMSRPLVVGVRLGVSPIAPHVLAERCEELRPVLCDVAHREGRGLAEAADRGLGHRLQPLVHLRARH